MAESADQCFAGCGRPAVGACPGYAALCGAAFCPSHGRDGLCRDCAARRDHDERLIALYRRYEAQSRRIDALRPNPRLLPIAAMGAPLLMPMLRWLGASGRIALPPDWLLLLLPVVVFAAVLLSLHRLERPFAAARDELFAADPRFAAFYRSRRGGEPAGRLLRLAELSLGEGRDAYDPALVLAALAADPADPAA